MLLQLAVTIIGIGRKAGAPLACTRGAPSASRGWEDGGAGVVGMIWMNVVMVSGFTVVTAAAPTSSSRPSTPPPVVGEGSSLTTPLAMATSTKGGTGKERSHPRGTWTRRVVLNMAAVTMMPVQPAAMVDADMMPMPPPDDLPDDLLDDWMAAPVVTMTAAEMIVVTVGNAMVLRPLTVQGEGNAGSTG